jgi:hypothetical protein
MSDIQNLGNIAQGLSGIGRWATGEAKRRYQIDQQVQVNAAKVATSEYINEWKRNTYRNDPKFRDWSTRWEEDFGKFQAEAMKGLFDNDARTSRSGGITGPDAQREVQNLWDQARVAVGAEVQQIAQNRADAEDKSMAYSQLDTVVLNTNSGATMEKSLENTMGQIDEILDSMNAVGLITGSEYAQAKMQYRDRAKYNHYNASAGAQLQALQAGSRAASLEAGKPVDIDERAMEELEVRLRSEAQGVLPDDQIDRIINGLQNDKKVMDYRNTEELKELREATNMDIQQAVYSQNNEDFLKYYNDNYKLIDESYLGSGGGYGTKEYWKRIVKSRYDGLTMELDDELKDSETTKYLQDHLEQYDRTHPNPNDQMSERLKLLGQGPFGRYHSVIWKDYSPPENGFYQKDWWKKIDDSIRRDLRKADFDDTVIDIYVANYGMQLENAAELDPEKARLGAAAVVTWATAERTAQQLQAMDTNERKLFLSDAKHLDYVESILISLSRGKGHYIMNQEGFEDVTKMLGQLVNVAESDFTQRVGTTGEFEGMTFQADLITGLPLARTKSGRIFTYIVPSEARQTENGVEWVAKEGQAEALIHERINGRWVARESIINGRHVWDDAFDREVILAADTRPLVTGEQRIPDSQKVTSTEDPTGEVTRNYNVATQQVGTWKLQDDGSWINTIGGRVVREGDTHWKFLEAKKDEAEGYQANIRAGISASTEEMEIEAK